MAHSWGYLRGGCMAHSWGYLRGGCMAHSWALHLIVISEEDVWFIVEVSISSSSPRWRALLTDEFYNSSSLRRMHGS